MKGTGAMGFTMGLESIIGKMVRILRVSTATVKNMEKESLSQLRISSYMGYGKVD
jgi:hypothetical protein